MKKSSLLIGFFLAMGFAACSDSDPMELMSGSSQVTTRAVAANGIQVEWSQENQVIEGFGVAQAGWAADLFKHSKREEVAALLFGSDGLKINMLRGQVFPQYCENEADTTFHVNDDVDMPLSDPYFATATSNDLDMRGQLWVTKKAKMTYNVDKLFFSTWSPPAFMKSNGSSVKGSLKPEYYQRFADFLAGFAKAYRSVGLDVYAISPVNEPNFEAEWNSCKWSEANLANFIVQNMGPTFVKEGVDTKIVFGEVAQWSTLILGAFNIVSAKKYVENVLKANPAVADFAYAAAGHGYNIPSIPYEFPIVPYDVAASKGLKVWQTEISTTYDTFDASMNNGLTWAETFYKYLTKANVNAFFWWAGARPTSNNESLIQLNDNSYVVTKRFDTYGNYTRYIKPGSTRVNVNKGSSVSSNVLVSSFKKDNEYVVVVVNKSSSAINSTLNVNGAAITGYLKGYVTDANSRWTPTEDIQPNADNTYSISVPPLSVVTFTGTIR